MEALNTLEVILNGKLSLLEKVQFVQKLGNKSKVGEDELSDLIAKWRNQINEAIEVSCLWWLLQEHDASNISDAVLGGWTGFLDAWAVPQIYDAAEYFTPADVARLDEFWNSIRERLGIPYAEHDLRAAPFKLSWSTLRRVVDALEASEKSRPCHDPEVIKCWLVPDFWAVEPSLLEQAAGPLRGGDDLQPPTTPPASPPTPDGA